MTCPESPLLVRSSRGLSGAWPGWRLTALVVAGAVFRWAAVCVGRVGAGLRGEAGVCTPCGDCGQAMTCPQSPRPVRSPHDLSAVPTTCPQAPRLVRSPHSLPAGPTACRQAPQLAGRPAGLSGGPGGLSAVPVLSGVRVRVRDSVVRRSRSWAICFARCRRRPVSAYWRVSGPREGGIGC
jgi:hypothetical protein